MSTKSEHFIRFHNILLVSPLIFVFGWNAMKMIMIGINALLLMAEYRERPKMRCYFGIEKD